MQSGQNENKGSKSTTRYARDESKGEEDASPKPFVPDYCGVNRVCPFFISS
jgi:hypothetical protein